VTWAEIFAARLSHVYLIYGLAFFVLGVAVALEIGRTEPTRFSRAMRPLAVFGLVHGSHEWTEMFAIIGQDAYGVYPPSWFAVLDLVLLAVSFASLIAFGVQMLRPPKRLRYPDLWISLGMLALYGVGVMLLGWYLSWQPPDWFSAAEALARYSLAIPGAILTAWALLLQRQNFLRLNQRAFANDLLWAALAFLLYGVIGQFFVGPSPLFPSNIINAQTFQDWFGIPVQVFRGIMAVIIAVFTIRALRSFEFNRQQELATARRRVEQEIARRNALRQEFLHRTVEMHVVERTGIARELHDQLGQALTGLAIGLRGTQLSIDQPDLLQQQLGQLEEMAVQALGDMRHLVNELRPTLLDDMGLRAALRHYAEHFSNLTDLRIDLVTCSGLVRFPGEIETTLFRAAQEALTNVARHAQAKYVRIELRCERGKAILRVEDDGIGFDTAGILDRETHTGWGLIGIQERVSLVNGDMTIHSEIAKGTTLIVDIPFENGRTGEGVRDGDH